MTGKLTSVREASGALQRRAFSACHSGSAETDGRVKEQAEMLSTIQTGKPGQIGKLVNTGLLPQSKV